MHSDVPAGCDCGLRHPLSSVGRGGALRPGLPVRDSAAFQRAVGFLPYQDACYPQLRQVPPHLLSLLLRASMRVTRSEVRSEVTGGGAFQPTFWPAPLVFSWACKMGLRKSE